MTVVVGDIYYPINELLVKNLEMTIIGIELGIVIESDGLFCFNPISTPKKFTIYMNYYTQHKLIEGRNSLFFSSQNIIYLNNIFLSFLYFFLLIFSFYFILQYFVELKLNFIIFFIFLSIRSFQSHYSSHEFDRLIQIHLSYFFSFILQY
jgi:hypothetical protein